MERDEILLEKGTFQPNFVTFTNTEIIRREPIEGVFEGNQNVGFNYVTFADGSGGIEKQLKDWHGNKTGNLYKAELLALQEYLSARVGEVMNAPIRDCLFTNTDAKTIIMPYIDGKTGKELDKENFPTDAPGTTLRLFDYLTANADRRPKNLMFTTDGRIVGIDHALCNFRPRKLFPEQISHFWNHGVTVENLQILRPKLANLQSEFTILGVPEKFQNMMNNLDNLIDALQKITDALVVEKDAFTPPQGVQEAAKKALEWLADGKAGVGFTPVGRKRASDLARGAQVSEKTLRRMKAYFDRHQPDKNSPHWNEPSPGKVAWYAWGGDAGYSWAKKMVAHFNREDEVQGSVRKQSNNRFFWNKDDVKITKPVSKGDTPGHPFHGNQYQAGQGGALSAEAGKFITDSANKFFASGGKVTLYQSNSAQDSYNKMPSLWGKGMGKDGEDDFSKGEKARLDKAGESAQKKYEKETDPTAKEQLRRVAVGYKLINDSVENFMSQGGKLIVASSKSDQVVATMWLNSNSGEDGKDVFVVDLGSTNKVDGASTAIQYELAKFASENNVGITSEAGRGAETYHEAIGRTIEPVPVFQSEDKFWNRSSWSAQQCTEIANLPIKNANISIVKNDEIEKATKTKEQIGQKNTKKIHGVLITSAVGLSALVNGALKKTDGVASAKKVSSIVNNTVTSSIKYDSAGMADALNALYETASKAGMASVSRGLGLTDAKAGGFIESVLGGSESILSGIEATTIRLFTNAITSGIERNLTSEQITSAIDEAVNNTVRAEMIAMTEANRAYNAGILDAFTQAGVTQFNWVVQENGCKDCAEQEGVHDVDTDVAPPLHPNCQCSIQQVVAKSAVQKTIDYATEAYELREDAKVAEMVGEFGDASELYYKALSMQFLADSLVEKSNNKDFDPDEVNPLWDTPEGQEELKKYSQDQPRDGNGRFSSTGLVTEDSPATYIANAVNAFSEAGGKVESHDLSEETPIIKEGKDIAESYGIWAQSLKLRNDPSSDEYANGLRLQNATTAMENALRGDNLPSNGKVLIATDKAGEVVGALSYVVNEDTQTLSIGFLGTTQRIEGAGTALQYELLKVASSLNNGEGGNVLSSVGYGSGQYHENIGRNIDSNGISSWTADQVKSILGNVQTSLDVQKGDTPGHDFHGNQWTQVGGHTADEHPKKWAKAIISELQAGRSPSIGQHELGILLNKVEEKQLEGSLTADITNLRIDGTNLMGQEGLGYKREDMPQIPPTKREEFVQDLATQGISTTKELVDPRSLQPSQSEIGLAHVAHLYTVAEGQIPQTKYLLVSSDNYVVDGHHNWAADVALALNDPAQQVPILRVDAPAVQVISIAHQWATDHGYESVPLGKTKVKKGDTPGHDFHGNQWVNLGAGGRDAKGKWESGAVKSYEPSKDPERFIETYDNKGNQVKLDMSKMTAQEKEEIRSDRSHYGYEAREAIDNWNIKQQAVTGKSSSGQDFEKIRQGDEKLIGRNDVKRTDYPDTPEGRDKYWEATKQAEKNYEEYYKWKEMVGGRRDDIEESESHFEKGNFNDANGGVLTNKEWAQLRDSTRSGEVISSTLMEKIPQALEAVNKRSEETGRDEELNDKKILLGQAITRNGMSASDYPSGVIPPLLTYDPVFDKRDWSISNRISLVDERMGLLQASEFRSALSETMQNLEPAIRISSAGLAKVLADNEFKNSAQASSTGAPISSNGRTVSQYNEIRANAENDLHGLSSETAPSERPIYGFMKDNSELDVITPSDIKNGNVNPIEALRTFVSDKIPENQAKDIISNPDNFVIVKETSRDQGRTMTGFYVSTKNEYVSTLNEAQKILEDAGNGPVRLMGTNLQQQYPNAKMSMNTQSWSVGDGSGGINSNVLSYLSSSYGSGTGHYGDTLVTLNSNVLASSTVTNGDSLDSWWAQPLPAQMASAGDPRLGGTGIYLDKNANGIDGQYLELQIFQHPTTSDIKSVTFTGKQPAPAITNKLDALGIPWVVDAPAKGSTTATKAVDFLANYKKK